MNRERSVVCHLSSGHRPDDVRIARKECATLAAAGYDVRFVVPTDNPPDLGLGFRIVAVRKPPTRRQRLLWTRRHVLRAALNQDADVYHVHDVDLFPVALGLKARGKRVVYDAHESYPGQIRRMASIARPLRWPASVAVATLERLVVAVVDAIITATPAIARPFPPHKTWVVQNFPLDSELAESDGPIPYPDRPKRFIFHGGLTAARGARQMVQALGEFGPAAVELTLCAQIGPAALRDDLRGLPGWNRIREAGWLDRRGLAHELGLARAGLLLFLPEPNHLESQPNKLFEYMAAGLPVIASDFPLWRQIVDAARCGLLVDPRDPAAIAEAMRWILENPEEAARMGRRGQEAVRASYTWSTQAENLLRAYRSVLATSARPTG